MSGRMILFILGFAVWAALNWPPDWHNITAGIMITGLITYIAGDLFISTPRLFKRPTRYFWFLCYIPLFLWECIKANLDVAYRVMHPDIPINPGIVKIKTNLKSDTALTFLANSITLTPGTMSVDIDKDNGFLYIHWINVKDKDVDRATKLIAGKFEGILRRIFE